MRWVFRLAFVVAVIGLLAFGRGRREEATAKNFLFAGSDSYGYLKLADELRTHRRYALGPTPEPLHWARPPVFPIYLMLAKGEAGNVPSVLLAFGNAIDQLLVLKATSQSNRDTLYAGVSAGTDTPARSRAFSASSRP